MKVHSFSMLICCIVSVSLLTPVVRADDDEGIIVEKNLFSPERKKWVMEDKPEPKKGVTKKDDKNLADISLYGTVIKDQTRYAILRTKKRGNKEHNRPYMVGDYINGYLIQEIDKKKIVLHDDSSEEDYFLFINDKKVDRKAEKTQIKAEKFPDLEREKNTKDKKKTAKKKPVPQRAQTSTYLKQRLKKDLRVLKRRKSKLVLKQAERDYSKLERLFPDMSDKQIQEALELKKELDRLKDSDG